MALVVAAAAASSAAFANPPTVAHMAALSPSTPLADARGRVPVTVRLREGEDAASLGLLEVAKGIGARWVPKEELADFLAASQDRSPWVSPPLHPLLNRSGTWTRAVQAHADGLTGKGVAVGIIDTGIDLTHPDFKDATGHTRVQWLLDLGASAPLGKYPDLEAKFGCSDPNQAPCAIWAAADIDASLAVAGTSIPGDSVGHGTHVSGIAASNGGADKIYVGMAPDAALIEVRVTRDAGGDQITDVDILNAMQFVFDRAEALNMPASVNLSLGGDFGPHDGTSPLEAGLGAFVGPKFPGRAIVVAAGNSAALLVDESGSTYGAHTEARVLQGETARAILTMPTSVAQTVKGTAYIWVNYRAGEDVSVGLEWNGTTLLDPQSPGSQGAVNAADGHPYVAVLNGVTGGSSLLPNGSYGAIVNIDGSWGATDRFAITFEGAGEVQLWVQGDGDAEFGSSVGGSLFLQPLKQGTVNVPATEPSLIAVGCTLNRFDWNDAAGEGIQVSQVGSVTNPTGDSSCYFSAAGPNALGVPKPEISAPGGFVAAAMSDLANPATNPNSIFQPPQGRCPNGGTSCYVVDDHHAIASGTSMSAPHVTGAVALLFQQDPTLTQDRIVAALQGGARSFQGYVPYDFQSGAGALDIEGAVSAVVTQQTGGAAPDVAHSWVTLSTGYARPDPTWPIVGDVEVRTLMSLPADGFDANALQLVTENAVVIAPLARVGPGLWRFTIAGADGTGGEELRAKVTYAGAVIADRSLPIGGDEWIATGVGTARGGCAIDSNRSPTRSTSWPSIVFASALAARLLRRRK